MLGRRFYGRSLRQAQEGFLKAAVGDLLGELGNGELHYTTSSMRVHTVFPLLHVRILLDPNSQITLFTLLLLMADAISMMMHSPIYYYTATYRK